MAAATEIREQIQGQSSQSATPCVAADDSETAQEAPTLVRDTSDHTLVTPCVERYLRGRMVINMTTVAFRNASRWRAASSGLHSHRKCCGLYCMLSAVCEALFTFLQCLYMCTAPAACTYSR